MAHTIPQTLDEVTPEWLTNALTTEGFLQGQRIIGTEMTRLGLDMGFLSCVGKFALSFDQPAPDAPRSVVVKVRPANEGLQEIGERLNAFEREFLFYKEVAPKVDVRLPKIFLSLCENHSFVIVMEDLSHCSAGDQVVGMPHGQVAQTAELIAGIQAKFWDNDALGALDWMPTTNTVVDNFPDEWDSFAKHFGHYLGPEGIALGEKLAEHTDWVANEIASRPRTITHFDLREDNLLFGEPGTRDEIIIIDWQIAIRSMGVFDVARLMAGSELPDERRGNEIEILRAWHNRLLEYGVDYYWEEALYDLRLALLECICCPVQFHRPFIGQKEGRSFKLTEAICTRLFASAVDLQADVALPK